MEVLDNSNPIKDGDEQITGANYTCRLPRDLNLGSGSIARSKNESDVRLLVACKTQLSTEVIKWKTESLRLQKERDSARLKMRELDQVVVKYSEKMRDLENRLFMAEDENKRLRGKVCCTPNISTLKKLSLSLDKFHSYPWSDTQTNPSNSSMSTVEEERSSIPQDDWKEVSQQLLQKMKQEMKELQELSCNFSMQENNKEPSTTLLQKMPDTDGCDDNLEESLSGLISETVSLKQSLLEQRLKLKSLLNKAAKGNQKQGKKERLEPTQINAVKPKLVVRHSDESFREFFTKQLEGCQNIEKMSKTMQLFMESESSKVPAVKRCPVKLSSPKSTKPSTEKERKTIEDERVCPICQTSFDKSFPQNEFEDHVLDHLEVESASLLDQYVVL